MAKHKLIVNAEGPETRIGLVEDGRLVDYFLDRKRERGTVGNIYLGRVSRVLPGMQAAFVDLGSSVQRKAYLHVADVLGAADEQLLFSGFDSDEDDEDEGGEKDTGKRSKSKPKTRRQAAARKIEDLVKEGQLILVQIVKEPVSQKGARVTGYVSLPGRHCVFMPTVGRVGVSRRIASENERRRLRNIVKAAKPPGCGFIVRTAAESAEDDEVRDDVDYLLKLWERIGAKHASMKGPGLVYSDLDLVLRSIRDLLRENTAEWIIDDEDEYERARKFTEAFLPKYLDRVKLYNGRSPIFDSHGIESQLRSALHPSVPLKSGGSLVIEQGEALTMIDVNTGSFVGGNNLEDTITRNNLEACTEVAHQLRVRNIGGIIVIDFVDMDNMDNRHQVWESFNKALTNDPSRANVTKISELGLVEMTRKRTRESLNQMLTDTCPTCSGIGRVKSPTTVAYDILREIRRVGGAVSVPTIDVECSENVAELLERYERPYLDELEKRFHKSVIVVGNPALGPDAYKVAGKESAPVEEPPKRKRRGGTKKNPSTSSAGGKSASGDKPKSRGGRSRKPKSND